jgi:hypothetical protein
MTSNDRMAFPSRFLTVGNLNPRVSKNTDAAVMRAMALSVEDRFSTVQEMAAATRGEVVTQIAPAGLRQTTKVMLGLRRSVGLGSVPLWALGVLAVVVLVIGVGGMRAIQGSGAFAPAEPTSTATVRPTVTATPAPSATPLPTATSEVRTSTPLPTAVPSSTPAATETAEPPTATPKPTAGATLAPAVVTPEPASPGQGTESGNPITFRWAGSLGRGQSYRVTARHVGSSYVIQSGLLTEQSWVVDLPSEHFGEWRWTVSVVRSDTVVATSAEGMFWFNPHSGPGGDGGDDQPTAAPVTP